MSVADQAQAPFGRPGHDPVAGEQDLLTIREAAARLHDELAQTRARLDAAASGGASPARIAALRDRTGVLMSGIERYEEYLRARLQAGS